MHLLLPKKPWPLTFVGLTNGSSLAFCFLGVAKTRLALGAAAFFAAIALRRSRIVSDHAIEGKETELDSLTAMNSALHQIAEVVVHELRRHRIHQIVDGDLDLGYG